MEHLNYRIVNAANKIRREGKDPQYVVMSDYDRLEYYKEMEAAFSKGDTFHGLKVCFSPYVNRGEIIIVPHAELSFDDITS